MFFKELVDGEESRLCVQRVEDGLHQYDVHSAVHQPTHLLGVSRDQLIKRDGSKRGIVDIRRHRRRAIGRAYCTGHESWTVRTFRHHRLNGFASHLGSRQIQLIDQMFQMVIGHRDRGGIERIGFDDVGPGFQVLPMNCLDNLRLGQAKQVVTSLEVRRMIGKLTPAVP